MELQKGRSGNPGNPTWGCSSAGRAPALHAGGQEFDPPHLHQSLKRRQNRTRETKREIRENPHGETRESSTGERDWKDECRCLIRNGRIAQVVRAHA